MTNTMNQVISNRIKEIRRETAELREQITRYVNMTDEIKNQSDCNGLEAGLFDDHSEDVFAIPDNNIGADIAFGLCYDTPDTYHGGQN